jgi:serine/threonine protein kinase
VDEVIAGRYRLGAPIGAGGMARVYAARDLRLERAVAIKLVPVSGIDGSGRARFVREARSSASFSHPNAVAVFDAGEADGFLYLVMELVDGPSLAAWLAERGPLGVDEAVSIAAAVLAALGAAHEAGIVHRDVKPGNILLGPEKVKLADFGIAKRLDDVTSDLTGTGQFVGTPKYLAPEQVMGRPATPASDLYAVGVVVYEMLAGRPPFERDTPVATAVAHRDAPIPDLRRVRRDVPEHVAAAVRTAMAKDPTARFASAAQMASVLTRHAGTLPVPPHPGRPPEQTQVMTQVMPAPPGRSRRWWWAAAVGVAAGGGVALALDQRGESPDADAGLATTTTAAPTTTAVPTTTSTTTTTTMAPTTTAAPSSLPAVPIAPASVGELIELLEQDPNRFGPRTIDFLDQLRGVEENKGRKASDRADVLLGWLDYWVYYGELSPDLVPVAGPLLEPIAGGPGGDESRGQNGDDDD